MRGCGREGRGGGGRDRAAGCEAVAGTWAPRLGLPATARGRQRLPRDAPWTGPRRSPCFSEVGHGIPSPTPPFPTPRSLSTGHLGSSRAQDGAALGRGLCRVWRRGGGRVRGDGRQVGGAGGDPGWRVLGSRVEGGVCRGHFKGASAQRHGHMEGQGWLEAQRRLLLRKRRPGRHCHQDLPSEGFRANSPVGLFPQNPFLVHGPTSIF